jgi:hypothetical protein
VSDDPDQLAIASDPGGVAAALRRQRPTKSIGTALHGAATAAKAVDKIEDAADLVGDVAKVAPNKGAGHCTDFADEAADIMEKAARSRGLTPIANVVNMAIPRQKILEKIAGKQKGIDYHLDDHIPELIGKADKGLVEYWRKEVHRLIDEMEG